MRWLRVEDPSAAAACRGAAAALAARLGFPAARTDELARNTLIHGGGGAARVEVVKSMTGRTGVKLYFTDDGPGIADLGLALTDGWTSGSGLGLGLSGARRLVDEFELTSSPGAGTSVVVVKWSR